MYSLANKMGGKKIGFKKRKLMAGKLNNAPLDQWSQHLAQLGPQGGCEAVEVKRYSTNEEVDVTGVIDLEVGTLDHDRLEWGHQELYKMVKENKNRKVVPKGRCTKELWQMALSQGSTGMRVSWTLNQLYEDLSLIHI